MFRRDVSKRLAAFLAAVLVLQLGAALPLAAQERSKTLTKGQSSYLDGIIAYNTGDFAKAVALLKVAAAEDPAEGAFKFNSNPRTREDYFPNLYLGLALDKLGRKDEAVTALRESKRQGAVAARTNSNLILESALRRLAPFAVAEARPTVAPTAAPPPTAPPAATRAPAAPPTGVPTKSGSTRPGATAVAAFSRPTAAPPVPTVSAAPTPASAEAASRAAVREGVRSFFKGELPASVKILSAEAERNPTARLFLSYALGSQYLLSARKDNALLARAKGEYLKAKQANPAVTGDTLISPALTAILSGS